MADLISRIGWALLVLGLLVWGVTRLVRRPRAARSPGVISVLASRQVTRGAAVAVLRVADRALVLGITDHQVSLLTEADLDAVAEYQPGPVVSRQPVPTPVEPPEAGNPLAGSLLSPRTWRQTVEFLRERTARR